MTASMRAENLLVEIDSGTTLHIYGVDPLGQRKLSDSLREDVRFEKKELAPDQAGEPATIVALVTVSVVAIRALAAWLMKERRRRRLAFTVEVELPDGRRVRKSLELEKSSSEAPSGEVLDKLAALLEVSPESLAEAVGAAD